MSAYRQLLQLAMVGVQQQPLPAPLAALASEWGEARTPAEAFFQASVLLTQAERCARPLSREDDPKVPPATPETLKSPDKAFSLLLMKGFDEPNPFVMLDKLASLQSRGEHLPFELLPAWLDYAMSRPAAEQAMLTRCVGNRGIWLAGLKPTWRPLLNPVPDDAVWETGSLDERRAWLTALRQHDPAAARVALTAVWPTEPPDAREGFIGCLEAGLSIDDEPLLEAARTDKRKEVRRQALDLLAQLPGSAFSQRMLARAESWLVYSPGGLLRSANLEVRMPGDYDNAWALDGIPERTTRRHDSIGDKANWLIEVISHVPLNRLLDRLQITPSAFGKLIASNEYAASLTVGSAASFERHPDPQMLPFLLRSVESYQRIQITQVSLRQAAKATNLDPWIEPLMAQEVDLSFVLPLLPSLDARWSRELLRRLAAYIDRYRERPVVWSRLLACLAERAHTSTLPDVLAMLDPLGNHPEADKAVTAAVSIADLRHKLNTYRSE